MTSIAEFAAANHITRLCHLTPVRNLIQIAKGEGLRSVTELEAADRAVYDQQDLQRLDGYPDHICCSIQYPNVWYLRQRMVRATAVQKLFPGWVCLAIDPDRLEDERTLFCPRNAAADHGRHVTSGLAGLRAMYAPSVIGTGGRSFSREGKPDSCPTDDQAEVLIAKFIPLGEATTVLVPSKADASDAYVSLELAQVDVSAFSWRVAPEVFETSLAGTLRSGRVPAETPWSIDDVLGT